MHLIHKQNSLPAEQTVLLSGIDGGPDFLDAGGNGGDFLHPGMGMAGDNLGQSCFTGSRRSPQNQGLTDPLINGPPQRFTRSQDVLLTDILINGARTHTGG